jgi:hypothetical protein
MTTEAEALARLSRSTEKLDNFVSAKAAMEHRQWRDQERARADELSEARMAQLEQTRKQADACRKHQARYDESFRRLGTDGAPPPHDGEFGGDYRRRLLGGLRDKLSPNHPFANVDFDDLDTPAIKAIEPQILESAGQEAEQPSPENLPKDDSMIERTRLDPMSGGRATHFFGRTSFIKGFTRPGRKVLRICNPDSMSVLWGQPFSRPPT